MKPTAPMPDQITWLSTPLAARRLGICRKTLCDLIDKGAIPAYRFGRVIRTTQHDLDAFIERIRIIAHHDDDDDDAAA